MNYKGLVFFFFFGFMIERCKNEQLFDCTKKTDKLENKTQILEIQKGNKCIFFKQNNEQHDNTSAKKFIDEKTKDAKHAVDYKTVSVSHIGYKLANVKIYFGAQSHMEQNESMGFRIAFDKESSRRIIDENDYYIFIFPRSYNKSQEALFKFNIDENDDSKYMQYKPLPSNKYFWRSVIEINDTKILEVPTEVPTGAPKEAPTVNKPSTTTLVLIPVLVFILILVVGLLLYQRVKKNSNKKNISILISPGDILSDFTRNANRFATHLKSNGKFSKVFFNGWLSRSDMEKNLEKLYDALSISNYVIIVASSFAKTSYEQFINQGENAPWKDEFVVGVSRVLKTYKSLLLNDRLVLGNRKVFVLYSSFQSASSSDVLSGDFLEKSDGFYDVSKKEEEESFFSQLPELTDIKFSFTSTASKV